MLLQHMEKRNKQLVTRMNDMRVSVNALHKRIAQRSDPSVQQQLQEQCREGNRIQDGYFDKYLPAFLDELGNIELVRLKTLKTALQELAILNGHYSTGLREKSESIYQRATSLNTKLDCISATKHYMSTKMGGAPLRKVRRRG